MRQTFVIAAAALAILGSVAGTAHAQGSPPGPAGGEFRHTAVPPPNPNPPFKPLQLGQKEAAPVHRHRGHRHHVNRDPAHVDACKARYRSYSARSDTFLGHDGKRHRCRI